MQKNMSLKSVENRDKMKIWAGESKKFKLGLKLVNNNEIEKLVFCLRVRKWYQKINQKKGNFWHLSKKDILLRATKKNLVLKRLGLNPTKNIFW